MQLDVEEMTRVVKAFMAHEYTLDEAAERIVALGFGPGFSVGGDALFNLYDVEAGRLRELAWTVARLYNKRYPQRF